MLKIKILAKPYWLNSVKTLRWILPCSQAELKEVFEQYDAFWFRLGFRITADLYSQKTRCKVIATPVTGIDHIDEEACRQWGICIVSLRGETAFLREVRATAELTLALTLALLRSLVPAANEAMQGLWRRDLFRGQEVYRKTVGIVGMGRLGRITAGYFEAMGAKVIGYDIREDFPKDYERAENLEALIEAADIVSLHVSYNPTTYHLLNKAMFHHFTNKKILVNTARGNVVDETALLTALQEGRLGGAALDVVQNEADFSPNNPLVAYALQHQNLLIVPHIGGNTFESFEKTERFIAGKMKEALLVDFNNCQINTFST
ncbi:MAG: hydroxyacid dehydrogenase [Saprospiraceae bacterium]|nr:hydroxyacid dehydrogenase [Saprospiraceae bacterium]